MAKKKTTQQPKYILVDTNFDEIVHIGFLDEIKNYVADFISDSADTECLVVFEIKNEFNVSAEPIGWRVELN